MSLVTAVIMPVKIFIYIVTQLSSLLRTVINIRIWLLYFTVLRYLKNWTV